MASQGPVYPTIAAGFFPWTGASNITSANGVNASASLVNSQNSGPLQASGFAFSVPSNATITGIVLEVGKNGSTPTAAKDATIQLMSSGIAVGTNKAETTAFWPGFPDATTYGGSGDTWGRSWTPSEINSLLGVELRSVCPTTGTSYVDYFSTTVYYATASSGTNTGAATFYMAGGDARTSGVPFYTDGSNGSALASGLALFVAGNSPATGGMTLFSGGSAPASGSVPLVSAGSSLASGGATLFSAGSLTNSAVGPVEFFIAASTLSSGQAPLLISGSDSATTGVPLYTAGAFIETRGMPIALRGNEPSVATAGMELVVYGTSASGAFKGAPFFAFADASANKPSGSMVLSVRGPDSDRAVRNVNMWVQGRSEPAARGLDLFVNNAQSGATLGAPLVITGSGVGDGMVPANRGMNLFLGRNTAAAATFYTQGPGTVSATGATFYIQGGYSATGTFPLAVPKVLGFASSGARLFTHGW